VRYLFIILITILIFHTGCANNKSNIKWNNIDTVKKNRTQIEIGDIIIKKKKFTPYSMFGHSAIFVTKDYIAEFPKIGMGFLLSTLNEWDALDSEVIILRYNNISFNLQQEIIKNILDSRDKIYRFVFNKKNNEYYYCSQFVWEIFYRSGKNLNIDIDLDGDGGLFVFPYDILKSDELTVIHLNK